jgi:hypothetical protein
VPACATSYVLPCADTNIHRTIKKSPLGWYSIKQNGCRMSGPGFKVGKIHEGSMSSWGLHLSPL